jgi:hypothetical protein
MPTFGEELQYLSYVAQYPNYEKLRERIQEKIYRIKEQLIEKAKNYGSMYIYTDLYIEQASDAANFMKGKVLYFDGIKVESEGNSDDGIRYIYLKFSW